MLELLALRKGMTISKDMFLSHLYGGMDEPELKIIDVFMCKLRKKLAAVSGGGGDVESGWGGGDIVPGPQGLPEAGVRRGGAALDARRAPVLQRGGLGRGWSGSSSGRGQRWVSVRPRAWGQRRRGSQCRSHRREP